MWSIQACVSQYFALLPERDAMLTLGRWTEDLDKELGNKEGWAEGFDFKTPGRGVATHVYAAFEPTLKSQSLAFTSLGCLIEVS